LGIGEDLVILAKCSEQYGFEVCTGQKPLDAPNSLPDGFIGTWSGSITQDGYDRSPYTAIVRITEGNVGDTVATGEFPTLDCRWHWTLKRVDGNRILVGERIDQGPECLDVDITLVLENGAIRYSFDGGAGRAVLNKG
jgi:hypothetical protein